MLHHVSLITSVYKVKAGCVNKLTCVVPRQVMSYSSFREESTGETPVEAQCKWVNAEAIVHSMKGRCGTEQTLVRTRGVTR